MWKLKIGTKLTLSVCGLLLLACGGIALLSYFSSAATLQQSVEETLPALADNAAKNIRLQLDNYLLGIEGIANRNVIRSMDFALQQPALKEEIQRLGYLGLGVVSPDGSTRYADGSTARLGDRAYVKEAFTGKPSSPMC